MEGSAYTAALPGSSHLHCIHDSSPVAVGMKRSRENGQEAEPELEPAPKKAFGFEMKLSSNMVKY